MSSRLIQSISILLVLTATTMAQGRREPGPSLQERKRQLEPLIIESAKRYRIDPRILRTVCFIESRFRPGAVSPKGAQGLMQFMPETARRYGLQSPHDPKAAIEAAAHYLSDLLRKFGGRVDLALAAYNAGEGTVEAFQTGKPLVLASGKIINPHRLITGGIPPYRETQEYVKSAVALLMSSQSSTQRSVDLLSLTPHLARRFPDRNLSTPRTFKRFHSSLAANEKTGSTFIEVQ